MIIPLFRVLPVAVCLALFVLAANAAVTPYHCFEPGAETFSGSVTLNASAGAIGLALSSSAPHGRYRAIINPGGPNEETLAYGTLSSTSINFSSGFDPPLTLANNHSAGEPVTLISEGKIIFSYYNDATGSVTIPKGILTGNYFSPVPTTYSPQPTVFQPGRIENAWSLSWVSSSSDITWFLNGRSTLVKGTPDQLCSTITYQGRLNAGGNLANGSYDLQFQGYDAEIAGTAQGPLLTLDNVPVTNGIFTVQLKLMTALQQNTKFRFLQIGVRPAAAPDTDPFTILSPRQPITSVPYAVNATYAANATSAVTATNATNATTATNATNATTASNASNLGGIPASSFLTNSSLLNQQISTVRVNGSLTLTNPTNYTLIPGLTKTVDVPANSSVLIATDGGVNSLGPSNTVSIVDIGIFVDGNLVSQRRLVVNNSNVPQSIENWSTMYAADLAPGNHTIEVRAAMIIAGQNAVIDTNPYREGQLTVIVIKK